MREEEIPNSTTLTIIRQMGPHRCSGKTYTHDVVLDCHNVNNFMTKATQSSVVDMFRDQMEIPN